MEFHITIVEDEFLLPPSKACFHQTWLAICRTISTGIVRTQASSLLDKPFAKSQCLWKSRDKSQIAFGGNSALPLIFYLHIATFRNVSLANMVENPYFLSDGGHY
jgi:hypothetical protein